MPRRNRLPVACFWPGAAQLWSRGMWSGLAMAIGFAIVLNVLIVATLVWTEWIGTNGKIGLALGLLGICLISAVVDRYGTRTGRSDQSERSSGGRGLLEDAGEELAENPDGGLFRHCQAQYLQGNWYEAETSLLQLLEVAPRDVEGALLLATLYRHRRRYAEAARYLAELERNEQAERWSREIGHERACLARALADESRPAETSSPDSNEPQDDNEPDTPGDECW